MLYRDSSGAQGCSDVVVPVHGVPASQQETGDTSDASLQLLRNGTKNKGDLRVAPVHISPNFDFLLSEGPRV